MQAHFFQFLIDRNCEMFEKFITAFLGGLQFLFDKIIFLRMLIFKTQVLQFRFDGEKTQAMSQRCIKVQCLSGNLELLGRKHRTQGSHIVQTVGDFDQDYTDIVTHGKQQLTEVFRLRRSLFPENTTGYLSQPIYNLGNLRTKHITDILYGIFRIFHYIVEQSRTNRSRPQSHFTANNPCNGNGVHDIGFAGPPFHAGMRLIGKVERLSNALHLPPVI